MASFKGYKRKISLEFDYDQVKEGVPNVRKQMAILNAEFNKASTEAELSGRSIDKLGAKYEFLSNKIKIQEQEVENYRKKLEDARNAQGNNTKAIQNNTASLQIAESKLAKTRAELDKVSKELDKNRLVLGKTGEEWDKLGHKMSDIGGGMTLKLTAPILAAGAASFKLGADLEDTMGKSEVVFQHNAREIEKWSETAIKRFGLSRVTALSMVTDFAAGFNQLGIDMQKSTEWSKVLTERVNDLSTYYNATIEETQNALTAIISGQTEPLKKFQIFMTQANLQQFAYQKGIKKSVQEMTEAEKVQLRYNYVIEKTAKAQGNFNREQDSATAQMNLFKESVKELGVSFSSRILPMFTPIIAGINKGIIGLSELSDGTKKFIVIAGGIIAIIGPVIFVLGKFFQSITRISNGLGDIPKTIENVSKAGKAIKGLLNSTQFLGFVKWAGVIAGVALAIAAVVTALNFLFGKGEQMNQFAQNMSSMFRGVGNSISNVSRRGNNIANRYIDGSHRDGLGRVPYDGYVAKLHQDEEVLRADDPRNRNNPNAKIGGDTYILQVNMDEVDEVYKLTRVFKEFKQTKRAGVVKYG